LAYLFRLNNAKNAAKKAVDFSLAFGDVDLSGMPDGPTEQTLKRRHASHNDVSPTAAGPDSSIGSGTLELPPAGIGESGRLSDGDVFLVGKFSFKIFRNFYFHLQETPPLSGGDANSCPALNENTSAVGENIFGIFNKNENTKMEKPLAKETKSTDGSEGIKRLGNIKRSLRWGWRCILGRFMFRGQ
jgi:hypothetical protein